LTLLVALTPAAVSAQPVLPPTGRINLGPLSVTPAMVVVFGRDSNAIRTSTGQPAAEVYGVPQVEIGLGRARTRLNFSGAVEFSQQQKSVSSDPADGTQRAGTINQYYLLSGQTGTPRLSLFGSASHRDHYAPPTDFAGFERGLKSRRIERDFLGSVRLRPGGRISFGGLATRAQLRYDADEVFQGVSLEQNLNRNITSYGGDTQVALTPLSGIGVSATYFQDRFLYAPLRDGNGLRVSALAEFSPMALLAGRVEIGYLKYTTLITRAEYGGPGYNFGLSLNKAGVVLDVSGARAIEFSFDPGQGYYISNGLDVTLVWRLQSWDVFSWGQLRLLQPQGPLSAREAPRVIRGFKGGIARRFGTSTRIGTDIEYYSTAGGDGFSGVRSTIFFSYGSTRLLRLDRPLPGGF
jgi:hypothetical protein